LHYHITYLHSLSHLTEKQMLSYLCAIGQSLLYFCQNTWTNDKAWLIQHYWCPYYSKHNLIVLVVFALHDVLVMIMTL